jgi:MinD-like ATPase involved in chromosome partitioning or flagellar assembly
VQRRGGPLKVSIAGKGGAGKTTLTAALARELVKRGLRVLAVDCDPNPNLAESFGVDSAGLERFSRSHLRRAGETLELARKPELAAPAPGIWLLGGPPSDDPLGDAVARGIAGVLLAPRFDAVVTDLGAGPEFTRMAVGGVLNPADLCVVLSDGSPVQGLTARRIESSCSDRGVRWLRWTGVTDEDARSLAARILPTDGP